MLLGLRIRALRERLKLSQEELSHRARIHTTYLSDVERGRRNIGVLNIARIAFALDLPLSELFSDFKTKLAVTLKAKKRSRTRV